MMSIEEWREKYNEKLKKYDQKNKNTVFERIQELYGDEAELLGKIEKLHEKFCLNIELHNCAVTLNNKVTELQNEFENAGISLFSHRDEDYGTIGPSLTGKAILTDMLSYTYDHAKKIEKHGTRMEDIILEKSNNGLEKSSRFGRIFAKLRRVFIPKSKNSFSSEVIDEINNNATECQEAEDKLWRYNIKDDVLDSVMKYIESKKYQINDAIELTYLYVIPDLERLGLSELIPEIKVRIAEYEKKGNSVWPYKVNVDINKSNNSENKINQSVESIDIVQKDTDEPSI